VLEKSSKGFTAEPTLVALQVLDQGDAPMPMPSFAADLKLHDLDNLVSNIFFFNGAQGPPFSAHTLEGAERIGKSALLPLSLPPT
jgi:hypothetical protein